MNTRELYERIEDQRQLFHDRLTQLAAGWDREVLREKVPLDEADRGAFPADLGERRGGWIYGRHRADTKGRSRPIWVMARDQLMTVQTQIAGQLAPIRDSVEQMRQQRARLLAQSSTPTQPPRDTRLTLPKLFDDVTSASLYKSTATAAKRYTKADLLHQLELELEWVARNEEWTAEPIRAAEALREVIRQIEAHPIFLWRRASRYPAEASHLGIYFGDGTQQRSILHENGTILFSHTGQLIRVHQPSDRPRKPREDAYGPPPLAWRQWGFWPVETRRGKPERERQDDIQRAAQQALDETGAPDSWI